MDDLASDNPQPPGGCAWGSQHLTVPMLKDDG